MGNLHIENEKNPAHRVNTLHTLLYLLFKLSIIIAYTGGHIKFQEKSNRGLCCLVIGNIHDINEKVPNDRF